MAEIVCIGGGAVGLTTAMLLAKDGHRVTVLERDAAQPPPPGTAAWDEWERRGVNQFRMIHFFLPRFRQVAETELPELLAAMEAAGALRGNPIASAPADFTGGLQPDDDQFTVVTGRRPVIEAAMASVAAATPGVTIHRGVAVKGLLTGAPSNGQAPHVVGVVTDDGTQYRADLVVDAAGRRSALPSLLTDIGAKAHYEEIEDSGFVYYGRHFRSADGSLPFAMGALLQAYDSVSILTLPADNGTWGVGIISSAGDAPLRAVRDVDTWDRVFRSYPLVAHWADGEALTGVDVMAKIEDRLRRFVVDGAPVATGILPVGDSWACTNPSVGRGVSIGALHAVALRDLLRTDDLSDPVATATEWDRLTAERVEPWYRDTLAFDRHRLAQMEAQIAGRPYETDDPGWLMTEALSNAAMKDPEVLRAFMSVAGMLERGDDVLARPGLFEKVIELGGNPEPPPGPSRAELVDIIGQ